jgi:hypothetical protein
VCVGAELVREKVLSLALDVREEPAADEQEGVLRLPLQGATMKFTIERGNPIYWHFMDRIRPLEQHVKDLEQQVRERDSDIANLRSQHAVELRDRDIVHAAELEDRTNEWRGKLALCT